MQTPTNRELPRYFGSVSYWQRRLAGVPEADNALFDKRRKEIHRYTIADVNGPLTLTVPIVKPHGISRATWEDVRISDHNRWWDIHRVALESAYGRTPFFEFYIDRFLPFLCAETPDAFPSILHLNRALESEIASILLLDRRTEKIADIRPENNSSPSASAEDSTPCVSVKDSPPCVSVEIKEYWQPRAEKLGFIPGLSILDLVFCLGPEAALYLRAGGGD